MVSRVWEGDRTLLIGTKDNELFNHFSMHGFCKDDPMINYMIGSTHCISFDDRLDGDEWSREGVCKDGFVIGHILSCSLKRKDEYSILITMDDPITTIEASFIFPGFFVTELDGCNEAIRLITHIVCSGSSSGSYCSDSWPRCLVHRSIFKRFMTIIRSVEKVILQSVAFRSSRFNRRVDRVIREFSSGLHNSIRDDIHGVSSYVRLLPIFIKTNGIESFVANRRGSIIDEDLYHALR